MTPAAFKKLALSFPGAVVAPHFDRLSFRVGKRIFATMTQDGVQGMVPVKPNERAVGLIAEHPGMFFSYGGWTTKLGSLGVHIAQANPKWLKALMAEAHARIAPKPRAKKVTARR